ncbi:uncharacterized protein HQ_3589A [Haloquadratum walsbyi DSM 16790]|uniref:Uncharacterized protein n=1 Tax=Haloquadratum walsbyi (strain DSM 16790 / HBSQ001) TaxID=362976 RepID=Q18EF1_HALWD|nr:uncharacterized protein HQ_3589A [Haloquadratum walsbyi DSM 16790]
MVATPETVLVKPATQHRNPTYKKDRDSHRAPTDVDLDELPVQEISDWMYRLAELIPQARKLTYEPIEGGRVYGNQGSIDANLTGVIGEIAVQEATGSIEQPIFLPGRSWIRCREQRHDYRCQGNFDPYGVARSPHPARPGTRGRCVPSWAPVRAPQSPPRRLGTPPRRRRS